MRSEDVGGLPACGPGLLLGAGLSAHLVWPGCLRYEAEAPRPSLPAHLGDDNHRDLGRYGIGHECPIGALGWEMRAHRVYVSALGRRRPAPGPGWWPQG